VAKSLAPQEKFFAALHAFAEELTAKFSAKAAGEPEDQLKPPVDNLFTSFGKIISRTIVLKGESTLHERLGRPDFAAHSEGLPIGYVELKAPGKGANPELFKGHDRDQWKRFRNVPNLIYTDGNEWTLYRNGEEVCKRIRFEGDIRTDGKDAVSEDNATDVFHLFAEFTDWKPIVPKKPKELAAFLAPFCRLIREEVLDSLEVASSPMHSLKRDVKALLFPDANDDQFADAYAQTVVFALLLAQMEGGDVLDLRKAYDTLEHHHSLLSRSLEFLTDKEARKEIEASLSITQRVIHEIPAKTLKATSATRDPWLFFYEDFLASYDPELRKKSGVYFTPLEVVNCQVRLIDEILHKHMGRKMGFVEAGVATLDPALGTGTYLLGIVEHALLRIEKEEGPGAVKGGARSLVHNLHGFEWMVGPYAVAQLRFSQALAKRGIALPLTGPSIYLTNTLESPHTHPPAPPLFHKPIAREHERALKIKDAEHILVCLGNPPYGRHEAASVDNKAITGGWVRYGDDKHKVKPILEDFLEPARKAGHGVRLKNLYNNYIYFMRWSLWKVFEHKTATGPGILSFITASSYLDGDAFVGVREHMRRICDHIDIIDVGGEGRGARQDENVFAIQTPVAILLAWRKAKPNPDTPAVVRYTRIEGTREEKLKILDAVRLSKDLEWESVPLDWQAPFKPASSNPFFSWPDLTELFPWQHTGAEVKRLWPVAPERDVLAARWEAFVNSSEKVTSFVETRDRKIGRSYPDIINGGIMLKPVEKASASDMLQPVRYSYRSFDRQWIFPDNRLGDYLRPVLWQAYSDQQIFFTSMLYTPLGNGPAMTVCSYIPDRHHFSNRGAKDILPLYRDASCKQPNILPVLLDMLGKTFGGTITPEDFAGYLYGILAQPEYTHIFAKELGSSEVHVPITKDGKLFAKVSEFGKELIWLHTYGERLTDDKHPRGEIPKGQARCIKAVSDQEAGYPGEFQYEECSEKIFVGDGIFAPVPVKIWEFEVSGLKVVQSWLGYRMKNRSGKKSSPLDDIRPRIWSHEFTRELLELLWVLERTVAGYPKQKELFEAVLRGGLFAASELPAVPEYAREAPKVPRSHADQMPLLGDE
jgi:hypothetical protein